MTTEIGFIGAGNMGGPMVKNLLAADYKVVVYDSSQTAIDACVAEGASVGDFNHDGKQDIATGFVWYEAPSWKMHVITNDHPTGRGKVVGKPYYFDPKGYSNCFACFAEDLNGDGWDDVIVVDFPGTPTWWFENPKDSTKE